MELIIGIVHLIHLEHRLQASLVKGRVVSHQWQSLNLWLNLSPYLWKYPGVHGILHGKSMHPCIPIGIILRLWLDETVVAIHNLTIPYYHNAHGANAGSLQVGSLSRNNFLLTYIKPKTDLVDMSQKKSSFHHFVMPL